MANKKLFASKPGPATDTINEAGGSAYSLKAEEALAQLTVTGCLNGSYYASEEAQLAKVTEYLNKCTPEFIAKMAVYAREKAFMKDMPALLCAYLAHSNVNLLKKIFNRVIDNGKMLRNFAQILRSGQFGRKSFGTSIKKLMQNWINSRDNYHLFVDSVGQSPSMADVIKMVHPKPHDDEKNALFAYLIDKEYNFEKLPKIVQQFEKYKNDKKEVPNVPFQMLTSLDLGADQWKEIAKNANWHMTRMNLNTFARHGVFEDEEIVKIIADRLKDEVAIKKARVFPYQIMMAYKAGLDLPRKISDALQDAMEIAVSNIPEIPGHVYIFPDVSGSMDSPVTGYRKGSTSAVKCVDVAALVAAAVARKCEATIIPFEQDVVNLKINPRDSVMTIASQISEVGGGGTNCSAPLSHVNAKQGKGDLIIYVSDNESWVDSSRYHSTATIREWLHFKKRNPKAKMICIDVQAYDTTQAPSSIDVLNVGGFSDNVFEVINKFVNGDSNWVKMIQEIKLEC